MGSSFFIAFVALVAVMIVSVPLAYSMQTSTPNDPGYMITGSAINGTQKMVAGFTGQLPNYLLPGLMVCGALALFGAFFVLSRRH